jgi:hypothetical protein
MKHEVGRPEVRIQKSEVRRSEPRINTSSVSTKASGREWQEMAGPWVGQLEDGRPGPSPSASAWTAWEGHAPNARKKVAENGRKWQPRRRGGETMKDECRIKKPRLGDLLKLLHKCGSMRLGVAVNHFHHRFSAYSTAPKPPIRRKLLTAERPHVAQPPPQCLAANRDTAGGGCATTSNACPR